MEMNKWIVSIFLICISSFFLITVEADDPMRACEIAIMEMMNLQNTQNLEMLDYTGKAINDLGNYDGCQKMEKAIAHYCVVQTVMALNTAHESIRVFLGLCAPAVCNATSIKQLMADALTSNRWNISTRFPIDNELNSLQVHCEEGNQNSFGVGNTITLVLTILLVCFVALGTLLEFETEEPEKKEKVIVVSDREKINGDDVPADVPLVSPVGTIKKKKRYVGALGKIIDVLKCFGLRNNTKLLVQDNRHTDEKLACLNGLRTIMMCWVILGHTFTDLEDPLGFDNLMTVKDEVQSVAFQAVPAAEFAVDVFFYLSGFLVVYMLLKEMNSKKGRVPWGLYYFHRYWRLTPVYGFIILVFVFLSPFLVSGPFHYLYLETKTDLCVNNWWTNMLYINNFIPSSSQQSCMGWSWYLANDMQFYILTPILVLLFRRNRKVAWAVASFLVAVSMVLNAALAFHYKYEPLDPGNDEYMSIAYGKPYTRMSPYLLGILVAFLMQEDIDITGNQIVRWIGYIIAGTVTTTSTYLTVGYWRDGWDLSQNVLYATFAKTGFTMAIGWVVYAMHKGHGGLLRHVLSMYFWVPLARLTYTAYLIHPIVMFLLNYSCTTVFHYSWMYITIRYTSNLLLAYAVGMVFYFIVEKPCANLERVLLPRGKH